MFRHRAIAFFLAAAAACAAPSIAASDSRGDALRAFLRRDLGPLEPCFEMDRPTGYAVGRADLNGDGRSETFVYFSGAPCGTGGCDMLVLQRGWPNGFRVRARTSVTKLPVSVLPTKSRGWQDISVGVCGGGILDCYQARLRFDGRRYPSNPTVPPAQPLRGKPQGRLVFGDWNKLKFEPVYSPDELASLTCPSRPARSQP